MAKEQPTTAPAADPSPSASSAETQARAKPQPASTEAGAPVASPSARAAGPKRKPRDSSPRSMPYLEQVFTLKSFHAQQTFRRAYPIASEALITLSVVLHALTEESECVKVEEVVNEKIEAVKKAIHDEHVRLDKLAETYGIQTSGIPYSAPQDVTAQVTSPRAVSMMSLIRDLDRLVELYDVLWLSHVIKDGEHSKGIFNTKRRIWRLANELRTLAIRSMASAQRRGIDDVTDPRSETKLDPDAAKNNASKAPAAQATHDVAPAQPAAAELEAEAVAA